MSDITELGIAAVTASRSLAIASTAVKNSALEAIASEIVSRKDEWLSANAVDIDNARTAGMRESMLDRLLLTDRRIDGIVSGIREVIALPDPVGRIISTAQRPNGLKLERRSVPLGVIGIIYEARPNVTVDAAALTLKSGNAVILRGGKEAINSNIAVISIMQDALVKAGLNRNCIGLITDTSRDSANALMNLTEYVDVLIPRGGKGLIRSVVANSKVPVIRTGEGVCHIYVDSEADFTMAAQVLENAKTSRPSVCNAAECVLIHEAVLEDFLSEAVPLLSRHRVELRCDEKALKVLNNLPFDRETASPELFKPASDEDWDAEYGDYILAVKTVSGLNEAVEFITAHGTGHSEAIMTENPDTAEEFLNRIDAAAVYWNASTRFTDGGEFGLGAEIGISTQKMHARGPMGLEELTSYKYIVRGNGQVR